MRTTRPEVIKFYQKNDFDFLTLDNDKDKTRLMFFDLIRFKSTKDESDTVNSKGRLN